MAQSSSAFAVNSQSDFTDDAIKILVVEDDSNLREALSDTLQLADYAVITANNAEDSLKKLAEYDDLRMIISDVNMGAMSGHDLLREVKANYPHIYTYKANCSKTNINGFVRKRLIRDTINLSSWGLTFEN